MLDATHCGGLEEGDRLIEIDGIDLRSLSHAEVVQVLKDFPPGRDAYLKIQRIHRQQAYIPKLNTGKICDNSVLKSIHIRFSRLLEIHRTQLFGFALDWPEARRNSPK